MNDHSDNTPNYDPDNSRPLNEDDLVLECFCMRRGTGVVCPSPALPPSGEGAGDVGDVNNDISLLTPKRRRTNLLPLAGGLEGGTIIPIERIQPGDYVFMLTRRNPSLYHPSKLPGC